MFHFVRPEWLWGLLPLFGLFVLIARKGTTVQAWESVCDAHLLPHLLVGRAEVKRRMPLVLLGVGWTLAVLALAGPVWSQLPQPVFRSESALVIVLDLSRSMDVQDVAPSRLTRAKHKILDILKARKEGQTALVVYAGEPFVVSPLTDDANTMVTLVQSLETDLMPLQGSRADLALRKAQELLANLRHAGGNLLLLTDGEGDPATLQVIEELRGQGHGVSVLGVGTVEGAPIPEPGGFLKDPDGAIVIPRLDIPSLQAMARAGGGQYATVTLDDQDINRVLSSKRSLETMPSSSSEQRTTDLWREEGTWLVLLLLGLALPAFRTGWLGTLLVLFLLPQVSEAFSWENLWFRPDQQGARVLERGNPEEAAALFQDPGWKGIAHYRAGKYQEAEQAFSSVDTAEGHYNRGNALAKLGRLPEALASYQIALTQQPHHADAKHNMEVIKKLLEQASSSEGDGEQSQQTGASSSKQQNDRNDARGVGKESSKALDSTHEQPDSGKMDAQKGKQEKSEAMKDHGFDASEDHTQPEKDQRASQENQAGETREPESSKAGESEPPVSSASSRQEEPEAQGEQPKVAPTAVEPNPDLEKSKQALQQWLRRIPDDPGGLLRRKFLLEHQRRVESGRSLSPQESRW